MGTQLVLSFAKRLFFNLSNALNPKPNSQTIRILSPYRNISLFSLVFILDLIYLNERYKEVENKLKHEGRLTKDHIAILQNGKLTIFALLGVCYMLVNEDITEQQIIENPKILPDVVFEYGAVMSNYKDDDIDYKLRQIVVTIVKIVTEAYLKVQDGTTSPSNFMKTDPKYYNDIVTKFMDSFDYQEGREIKLNWDIFKR